METPSDGGKRTIIERVLKLRRCMGITNELSTVDPRDTLFFLSQVETSVCAINVPDVHDRLRWLAWPDADAEPHPGLGPSSLNSIEESV